MSTWSTRAPVRGTGPPWSIKNPELLPSPSPRVLSPVNHPPAPNEDPSMDWLQYCQLSAHGDLTVTERLATLLDTGQLADVTIRVGQGAELESFKAHRLMLASASQPLYRLVSTVQSGHSDFNTFRIPDVDPTAFKSVLKFIYTDEVNINSIVEAFSLLKAGKKWNLMKLNNKTIIYLDTFLETYFPSSEDKKNEIFDLLLLAEAHSVELFEKCLNTVIKYAKDIIPCQGFLRLDERTIRRLIGDKNFKFEDQLGLFEAIRDWGMNQILLKGLSPAQLHPIIEDLLKHIDFANIKDKDFMGTILPSDCLGRAEVIAFFMSRGMDIPRDMGFNNTKQRNSAMQNGEAQNFKRVNRFKKGYRLPHKEIYQEHELRFRVDQNVKLLGVGFGFLFSNTDMGVTVHCQGPWETVQWTDITQTYCRVSWEQMRSANVRLMFPEPARLEAKHCYKILIKVTRMTAGSSEVELWGGKEGAGEVEAEDAKFDFIKAAVDPKREVEPIEMDTKQGMVTELLYIIDDSPPPTAEENVSRRRRPHVMVEVEEAPEPVVEEKSFIRRRPFKIDEDSTDTSLARKRPGAYNRWQPSVSSAADYYKNKYSTKEKTPEVKVEKKVTESYDSSSYYSRKRPSPVKDIKPQETPSFLRSRITTPSSTSDSPFGERLSTRTGARPSWSRTRNTDDSTQSTSSSISRYGRDTTATITPSSRYGRDTTASTTPSRYGRDTTTSTAATSSRYGRDSSASKDTSSITSRVKTGDEGSSGSSIYRRDSATSSSTIPSYRRDSIKDSNAAPSSSLSRTNSVTSRYGRDPESSINKLTSRFGRDSSATRYGSSIYGSSTYGTGSSSRYSSGYVSRFR